MSRQTTPSRPAKEQPLAPRRGVLLLAGAIVIIGGTIALFLYHRPPANASTAPGPAPEGMIWIPA